MWLTLGVAACGDSGGSSTGDAQTPPMGASEVEAWLAGGSSSYKTWATETAVHASRSPSPHLFNRIYSNALIASNATAATPWPKGAAAVKELYATADGTTPVGYAVYLKTESDTGPERIGIGTSASRSTAMCLTMPTALWPTASAAPDPRRRFALAAIWPPGRTRLTRQRRTVTTRSTRRSTSNQKGPAMPT